MWLNELLKFKGVLLEEQQLHSFHEVETMFDEKMEAWFKQRREEGIVLGREEGIVLGREQGLEQGLEQGRLRAKRELVSKLLRLKFGEDPDRAARVEAMDEAALDLAVERILTIEEEAALLA
jgi:flagellar biosynthesis/type III secretory pathway protein FliH